MDWKFFTRVSMFLAICPKSSGLNCLEYGRIKGYKDGCIGGNTFNFLHGWTSVAETLKRWMSEKVTI